MKKVGEATYFLSQLGTKLRGKIEMKKQKEPKAPKIDTEDEADDNFQNMLDDALLGGDN